MIIIEFCSCKRKFARRLRVVVHDVPRSRQSSMGRFRSPFQATRHIQTNGIQLTCELG